MPNKITDSSKKQKTNLFKNKIFIVSLIFIVLILLVTLVIFFINRQDIKDNHVQIGASKPVSDLEGLQVMNVYTRSFSSYSMIDVVLKNTSDKGIDATSLVIYLLGPNNKEIFGTSMDISYIEPSQQQCINILCTCDLNSVVDYRVEVK